MPYVKILIHAVWTTKNREKIITDSLREELINHIKKNAKEKSIFISELNCVADHIHCLISLGTSQNIADVIRLIKGESSHWVNDKGLTKTKFGWQDDYYAVSVCESQVNRVSEYIKNQKEHHKRKSFSEEVEDLIQKHDFGKSG